MFFCYSRLLTALCHRQSEATCVTILLYDIVRVLHHIPAIVLRLALNITAVWPAVFQFNEFNTQVSNCDDVNRISAESSYSPLRHALCIALKKWSADVSLGDERYLFELLWPSNHLESKDDLSKLASELVNILKHGSFDSGKYCFVVVLFCDYVLPWVNFFIKNLIRTLRLKSLEK